MTIQEVETFVRKREKENNKIELKSFRKLTDTPSDFKKDIASEIVAFANRYGGKIIFGVNNDGGFDGKLSENIDKLKELIFNTCKDNISPAIDCTIQFLEDEEKDVVILYVPKRTNIPFAVTENKTATQIKNRIYYIRTSHGKSLVSDNQLDWMFKESGEPTYSHPFRVAFEFDRDFSLLSGIVPLGNYTVSKFLYDLSQEEREELKNNNDKLQYFFNEMMPYLLLNSFADFFSRSWNISIQEGFDRAAYGTKITNQPIETKGLKVSEIPVHGESMIKKYSWDFEEILNKHFARDFHIPPNTEIYIKYEEADRSGRGSSIVMENAAFTIEIFFYVLGVGSGLHPKGTNFEILSNRMGAGFQGFSMANYLHFDAAGHINGIFKFPEYDMSQYKEYFDYYEALKKLINTQWNYDEARSKYPDKEILIISNKLDDVLSLVNKPAVQPKDIY